GFETPVVAGQRGDDPRGFDPPDGLDGPPRRLGARRAVGGCGRYSWPVRSRHALSLTTHSLSWGNSSMPGMRRISHFVPVNAGMRLAHSIASSFEATSIT